MIQVVVRHKKGNVERTIPLGEYLPSELDRIVALYQKHKPVGFSLGGIRYDILKNQVEITVNEFVPPAKSEGDSEIEPHPELVREEDEPRAKLWT